MRAEHAAQLVENPAFAQAFEDYRLTCFKGWTNESDPEKRDAIYHKMQACREVEQAIRNRALEND